MAHTYDLIVIGGGAAGLTAAGLGATLGVKTLMIEREKLGGDCTWYGCIPSKTLLKTAKVVHQIRHASRYGLTDQEVALDARRVMEHVRTVREAVYEEADRPEIYEEMGVEVRHGRARFIDPHTVLIEGEDEEVRVSGRYFVVAAGARASVPPIEGLADVPYLTNESLFELEHRPDHLAVIGGGSIGTEMAQAFRRLGSEVTVIDMADRILTKDDPELVGKLLNVLQEEGVRFVLGASVRRVAQAGGGIAVALEVGGEARTIRADALLVATGRRPNLEALGLEAAGLTYTRQGLTVDDRCRTNQKHIYAAGDVTGRYQFTHMSEHMAKVAATNALMKVPTKIDRAHVPWVTFTDPELAHLGATESELERRGTSFRIYRFPYHKIDRAITEGEQEGLLKVYARPWTGKILGASILGGGAGDLICEYAVAMRNGVTLRQISDTIHPYPTLGLGARRAADQWYVRHYTPWLVRALQKVFGYRGSVLEPDPDRIL